MPEIIGDNAFVAQEGLAVAVAFPVQQLLPPYAAVGEPGHVVQVYGGAAVGDVIKFMPRRTTCDALALEPIGSPAYRACACEGAADSAQGGALGPLGLLQLLTPIATEGEHVVCHAFRPAPGSSVPLSDAAFEPQRTVRFEGVVRSAAVSTLGPNSTLVHMELVVGVTTPYAGYVRFVLAPGGNEGAAPGSGRRLTAGAQANGDPCADAASLVVSAPGGALGAMDGDGVRQLQVHFEAAGTYRMCHAYQSQLVQRAEAEETFTLQQNLSIVVSFAIGSVTPRLVLINERTTLFVPGAVGGDYIKLVQVRAGYPPTCAGAAASLNGGMIRNNAPGRLTFRVVDALLFVPEAPYLVCLAFNYTEGLLDEHYHPQDDLNVTVAFPVQVISPLDHARFVVRATARKRLSLRLPTRDNFVKVGDALVVLPASNGGAAQCVGAAALHRRAACEPADTGDVTAASHLELPIVSTGNGPVGLETRLLRLQPGLQVLCHAFAADVYVAESNPPPPPPSTSQPPQTPVRCTDEAEHVLTDNLFRAQYGLAFRVEYPAVRFETTDALVGQPQRVVVHGGVRGDRFRWVPACELGCGHSPLNNSDFAFETLGAAPSPPPPPPMPPAAPTSPAALAPPAAPTLTGISGAASIEVGGLRAALYKGCYAYQEDVLGTAPQMAFVVEIPLVPGVTELRIRRNGTAHLPLLTLAHDTPVDVTLDAAHGGDWAWLRLPMLCTGLDTPIVGCASASDQLGAMLEVDGAFSRAPLRYHSHHVLLAHRPVVQPAALVADAGIAPPGTPGTAAAAVGARECFDGLDEGPLSRLAAGYLLDEGPPEVGGVRPHDCHAPLISPNLT